MNYADLLRAMMAQGQPQGQPQANPLIAPAGGTMPFMAPLMQPYDPRTEAVRGANDLYPDLFRLYRQLNEANWLEQQRSTGKQI